MIVRADGQDLLLFLQTDHARLAGDLCAAWGNAGFERPRRFHAMHLAACLHDEGWSAWDRAPRLDPATRRPYQFFAVPYADRAAFYPIAVNLVAEASAYAGLMVSMHTAALWAGYGVRPPLDPATLAPADREAVARLIQAECGRQAALRNNLTPGGALAGAHLLFDREIQANFLLLTAWDALSLILCLHGAVAGGEAALQRVPPDYGGATVPLRVAAAGPGQVCVDPYPFAVSPLRLGVPARRVPNRDYENDTDFQAVFLAAAPFMLQFTVLPAGGGNGP